MANHQVFIIGFAIGSLFLTYILLFSLVAQDPKSPNHIYEIEYPPLEELERICGRGEAVQKCYGQNVCRVARVKCPTGVKCVELRTICTNKRQFVELLKTNHAH